MSSEQSEDRSFRSSWGAEPWGDRVSAYDADMDHESDQVSKEHSVDALALRGDEGRGTLR